MSEPNPILKRLEGGLVLWRAVQEDIPRLVDFESRVQSDASWDQPDRGIVLLMEDLLGGQHPTVDRSSRKLSVMSLSWPDCFSQIQKMERIGP